MTVAHLLLDAEADGVTIQLSDSNEIKASGSHEAVTRWLPFLKEHKVEIIERLQYAKSWWRVYYEDRAPVEVCYYPPVTHAEVMGNRKGAVRTESFTRPPSRKATVKEEEELRSLITALLADAPEAEEAVQVALGNVEAALKYYQEIVKASSYYYGEERV